mmetsp:Transcript_66184/g.122163  ORF Transcript_66184/g.122163 Transcript_66184/m.122163 type:complete len:204 (-) Transcript_66184:393-1004(-)
MLQQQHDAGSHFGMQRAAQPRMKLLQERCESQIQDAIRSNAKLSKQLASISGAFYFKSSILGLLLLGFLLFGFLLLCIFLLCVLGVLVLGIFVFAILTPTIFLFAVLVLLFAVFLALFLLALLLSSYLFLFLLLSIKLHLRIVLLNTSICFLQIRILQLRKREFPILKKFCYESHRHRPGSIFTYVDKQIPPSLALFHRHGLV